MNQVDNKLKTDFWPISASCYTLVQNKQMCCFFCDKTPTVLFARVWNGYDKPERVSLSLNFHFLSHAQIHTEMSPLAQKLVTTHGTVTPLNGVDHPYKIPLVRKDSIFDLKHGYSILHIFSVFRNSRSFDRNVNCCLTRNAKLVSCPGRHLTAVRPCLGAFVKYNRWKMTLSWRLELAFGCIKCEIGAQPAYAPNSNVSQLFFHYLD